MITSKQRAFLRSKANDLDAIFQVGKGGVNDNLIGQLNDVLEVRELIKIKVLESSMLTAREASDIICEATGAEPIQCIGTKLVIYKPSTKEPKIILPKA
ncbi:MAG: ribosome assembly RNA-binding protein YhbY [Clostridia bacterium]|nr:ribosome assembly RNA-binding protein YhbY [Clostridia bacterium]MBQ2691562.1 ribosome assembly RNA-binding protein YhbY [Clostridia bacterium]MBQ3062208.1 ribosome assembly RNA-binding protein YhbY [Clostridia bacterium]MBQ5813361.1 ribosome assembly RNA-binding protein YhbY [Clostridia bacterium]MBQ9966775.1 ribosome assembly RNA-binding protein YhbY [Clostridia bacterium]